MASFCKTCQQNGVNTRVEWRPNPDKPGKNKPFDIDKNEWHSPCPFWKPTNKTLAQGYTPATKSPSTQQGLVEEQVNQGIKIEMMQKEIGEMKRTLHDLGKAIAYMSNKTAKQLMEEKEEVQEE
jgi:hypothetical protein